jgi:N-acetylneuraminic acid mutarotase
MSWTAVASLPEALTAPACAEHGGKLYAFGGDATQTHAYVYDPGTNTWTALANVTTGGFVNTAVAFGLSDGNIYIVDVGSPRNFTKYDPVANTYSAPTAPPQSWVGAGACSDGSLIYFLEYPSGSTNQLPQVSVYDPTTDTWSSTGTTCPGAIAPHGLASGSCFLLGTEIWYFNGWPNAATSPDGVVVKYDIATDTWSAAGTTEPAPNRMNGVPTLSGVDFPPIIGGEDASLIYDTVDLWDGAAWSSYAVLPVATTVAGGAVVGSNVYVVGGYTTGPVASVYRAPLADFTATTTTVNTGLVTGRTARGFYAHFGPVAAAAMHAGRVARG